MTDIKVSPTDRPAAKENNFASWKFQIENTVNADPLADGACLQVLRAYLDFMTSADARPYRSLIDLQVATSLAENTIIDRRRKLVQLGYFKRAGKTSDGAVRYRVVNARESIVLDHQIISRETLRRLEAEKKERTRARRRQSDAVAIADEEEVTPSPHEGLSSVWPLTARGDSPSPHEGNNVYDTVESLSMERRENLSRQISFSGDAPQKQSEVASSYAMVNRAGMTPNEFVLQAAAEKLAASGRHFSGLFNPGDVEEAN
ncbi:hypothetical protein [Rhizobium bangladeshense]|uniref:hypothetical protein n=1 Tax=Rhizobium bangladeshense TaxID=1138189 RepID=UPI001C82B0AA|nr:hypothetical protein [Rhizobium bangladeshense]MBX4898599.1 hypothetical protein [Rhizobium bangladeshense]MBY3616622.1 hypothetical protein [Rhizobium bangladeshense]